MEFEYGATRCIAISGIASSLARKKIRKEKDGNDAEDEISGNGENSDNNDDVNELNDSGDVSIDLDAIEDDPKMKESPRELEKESYDLLLSG